ALLVLTLVYAWEGRPWALAAALFLGVLAKETAVLAVPVYLVCQGRPWRRAPAAALLTAAVFAAALLAKPARLLRQGGDWSAAARAASQPPAGDWPTVAVLFAAAVVPVYLVCRARSWRAWLASGALTAV